MSVVGIHGVAEYVVVNFSGVDENLSFDSRIAW